jgi:hypothetical protein
VLTSFWQAFGQRVHEYKMMVVCGRFAIDIRHKKAARYGGFRAFAGESAS